MIIWAAMALGSLFLGIYLVPWHNLPQEIKSKDEIQTLLRKRC